MRAMGAISYSKYVGVVIVILLWNGANAQPGFISIDCGGKTNRSDPETNLTWSTDDKFIHVGNTSDLDDSTVPFYLQRQRVFSKPLNKSCYHLSITPNVPIFLKLKFYGNNFYQVRGFNYSIEASDMLYIKNLTFDAVTSLIVKRMVLVSSGEEVYICLIRTSECDDPFISAIELRTLKQGMYNMAQPGTLLSTMSRYDLGGGGFTRYPRDPFDRLWIPRSISGTQVVNSTKKISVSNTQNFPPSNVMQTAVQTRDSTTYNSISLYLGPFATSKSAVILYLAELIPSQSRSFYVAINNVITGPRISLMANFSATELHFLINRTTDVILTLFDNSTGSIGSPIINAVECFGLIPTQPLTFVKDVKVLYLAKTEFGLENWTSDPCFGIPWEGIRCNTSSKTVRVYEINLSGKNLGGSIPLNFGELTELVSLLLDNNHLGGALPNLSSLYKLERLHLQNNLLSGKVPDWLSQLHCLKELFIQNNNFYGVIPQELTNKRLEDGLNLRYSGNKYLCVHEEECRPSSNSTSSSSKWRVVGSALGVTGGGILTAILVGITVYRKKSQTAHTQRKHNYFMVLVPNSSKSRAFTLEEMKTATDNFSHIIGHGGFGSVFLGNLQEGKKIAVKVLSCFTKQGIEQFLNEVDLLSKINHKKLVSLLGYCNESKDLMLVYDYMPGGSLSDNLYYPQPSKYPHLNFKTRLKIALDAAQGLEYLHVGCNPKIIHRDVKTANILLDNDLNGKLADFGLSRVTTNGETSQINTTIKGTPGYLDPKYYQTHILTEKSDVYSFGIVLLEMVCGRKPIDIELTPGKILLAEWVAQYVGADKDPAEVAEIIDKRLGNQYNMKSMIHVAKLACRCIASEPSCRPTMSDVVLEIKEALTYEDDNFEVTDDVPLMLTANLSIAP